MPPRVFIERARSVRMEGRKEDFTVDGKFAGERCQNQNEATYVKS
jgi:hypothetical protein